jgi:phage terminase large subunit-like protein
VRLDQRSVLDCLVAASQLYDIQAIGYDPWHADKLLDDIERALELNEDDAKRMITPISQTFAGMSSACLKVQADILSGEIDAGGCPVTGWSVGNVVPNTDGKANLMFAKGKSRGRIDPVIAATIATACFLKQPPVEDSEPFLEFVGGVRR